jgi:hypothetical protein
MRAFVDEFALAQGRIACRWFRGWAYARPGQPREAYRRIREAYEENTRLMSTSLRFAWGEAPSAR